LILVIQRNYSHWVDTRPWAYLNILPRGDILPLTNRPAMIGRKAADLESLNFDISLPERDISRLHLQIATDHKAFDERTLFGTAINARPLPYGRGHKLQDGDIITLSGIYAFRFFNIDWKPSHYLFGSVATHVDLNAFVRWNGRDVKGSLWGLVVDGKTRQIFPLTGSRHIVAEIDDGSAVVDPGKDEIAHPVLDVLAARFDRESLLSMTIEQGRSFMVYRTDQDAAGSRIEKAPLCNGETRPLPRYLAFRAAIGRLKASVKDDDRDYSDYFMPQGEIVIALMTKKPGNSAIDCFPVHQFLFSTPSGTAFQVLLLAQGVAKQS